MNLKVSAQTLARSRFRIVLNVVLCFVIFNLLVRIGLAIFNGESSVWLPWRIVPALLIGALFDIGVAAFLVAPLGALVLLWPSHRGGRGLQWLVLALLLPLCVLMVFVGFAEFTFWNEFASRFNFIAVDYLIYTNEVVGNIRESYNLPVLLSGVGALSLGIWWLLKRQTHAFWHAPALPSPLRWGALCFCLLAPWVTWGVLDARYKEFSADAQTNEIAGNGYFDFWHAFWTNEIDYERFYATLPRVKGSQVLGAELAGVSRQHVQVAQRPFERQITAAASALKLNVVLISVESFSAEFMAEFGDKKQLTPAMNHLAQESLFFTRLYATGTRTVRGLEAITLSVPPTPGHSIVKRPLNGGLFTLGEVFKSKGYEPLYLYGGYSYFDNMQAFFSGNGYTVIDRSALPSGDIHFENIWGVADEDLFTLALRELDARQARGAPFFAHVMTTSNHRPFTYPEGRIDIPSKTGRDGGVKYTDWALGNFIERAKTKPWFKDTVFVILADHTHKGRGHHELPIENYHIPMLIYSPAHIKPAKIDSIASQIDVAPTLLGLLNMSYTSKFFGQDILTKGQTHQRAFMANYQTVGYYQSGRVVELRPNRSARVVLADTGWPAPKDELSQKLIDEAISYYQVTSSAYREGALKKP